MLSHRYLRARQGLRRRGRYHIVQIMNDSATKAIRVAESRRQQGGPPLVLVGGMSMGLFISGLVVSSLLGGVTPVAVRSCRDGGQYYRDHPAAVQAQAIFLFASSVPLLIYASHGQRAAAFNWASPRPVPRSRWPAAWWRPPH